MASYFDRLNRVIPGGCHTYSKGFDQFPSNAPEILVRGYGSKVYDLSGREYLDYGMGLRSVTLGYSNDRVNSAAINEIERGNNLTRPSLIELEAAELFVDKIPGAEMVKFAKNGSNVTTAAIKLARAYTGREFVCVPAEHPFFSFDDWFIGATPMTRGVLSGSATPTLHFRYNDIESLKLLFDEYKGKIAAVILEPCSTELPCHTNCEEISSSSSCKKCPNHNRNFLHQVHAVCEANGSMFILDEMISGFRWSQYGAASHFGVTPDLMTFGKGMANGFSLAALAGRREIMALGSTIELGAERTFLLSSTHGAEMSSLGAFVETMRLYEEENVCDDLWEYGANLKKQFNEVSAGRGLKDYVKMIGPAAYLNYVTLNEAGDSSFAHRTLLAQQMIENSVLMPWVAPSWAHSSVDLDQTLSALDSALQVYACSLDSNVESLLIEGRSIKPVFRKYN